nr:MBOAT family O-acyltransferase [Ferruginibacter sp.]
MYVAPLYILVPIFIIAVTYFGGIQIEKAASASKRRIFYLTCIILNVGTLVFFKYTNFFTNMLVDFANYIRQNLLHVEASVHNIFLISIFAPLGISYITFQAIGYLIEIKRGNQLAEKNIGYFATYLLYFPKVIAGPVERAHHFLPQFTLQKKLDFAGVSAGLKQILWGLFKKLVIADRLSIYISTVFDNTAMHSGYTLALCAIFYVFQMYADFSGYTDMALGFSKLLGLDLMPNFNRPLAAKSVTEFWRKWHISLSTWFGDYFYNPIAIAKRDWGQWAVIYASFITFIVLGFWHGANWTFIVFGFLQGAILTIEFLTKKIRKNLRKKIPGAVNNTLGVIFTFCYFAFSLIFFRANSVTAALDIIKGICHFKGSLFIPEQYMVLYPLFGIGIMLFVEWMENRSHSAWGYFSHQNIIVRYSAYLAVSILILLLGVFDGGQFIYFQF